MATHRSPLAEIKGLGVAHHGVSHWRSQRATAVAALPLTLWFIVVCVVMSGAGRAEWVAWFGNPVNASLMALFVVTIFWHAQLGLQVVIEDYVDAPLTRFATLLAVNLVLAGLAIACLVSIVMIAL